MILKNIYTSIDLGTDTIKVVVCELFNDKLNLLASSTVKSKGIKKGLIVNANDAASSIKQAIQEIEKMLGIEIKKVIAAVPSNAADFHLIKGEIEIKDEDKTVTSKHILKVLQKSIKAFDLGERELVTTIPVDFKLDNSAGIINPIGKRATLLMSRAILISTPRKNIISVLSLFEALNIEVVDIMLTGVGDLHANMNKDTKERVGSIINIGSDIINIALYNKGNLIKNQVLNIGGSYIDDCISKKYNINLKEARRIKEKFALANTEFAYNSETYEISQGENKIIINQREVSELVEKCYLQIFQLIKKEIVALSPKSLEYLIFTGGATNTTHFDTLVTAKLGKRASVGKLNIIGLRNNSYSSVVGNIIYYINKAKLKEETGSMLSTKDTEDIASVKKNTANISSDSMLEKVVGYFFGE